MRVIRTSDLELVRVDTPPDRYAILSHTWGQGEVDYTEFTHSSAGTALLPGYQKIEHLCKQAVADGLEYAWIDTVCINKNSDAELSEAINSMFSWYSRADICYAFLEDVDDVDQIPGSRWLTRGWTLQELIAPREVVFYNRQWEALGRKIELASSLAMWTGIDSAILEEPSYLHGLSIATRMRWAAYRQTRRPEDIAYSMMGIFGVNMPLLYGEGTNAFIRLQEEIMKRSDDMTILVWSSEGETGHYLAPDPSCFMIDHKVVAVSDQCSLKFSESSIEMQVPVVLQQVSEKDYAHGSVCTKTSCICDSGLLGEELIRSVFWAILPCRFEGSLHGHVGIEITKQKHHWCRRSHPASIRLFQPRKRNPAPTTIVLRPGFPKGSISGWRSFCMIKVENSVPQRFQVMHSSDVGAACWNRDEMLSEIFSSKSEVIRKFIIFDKSAELAIEIDVFISCCPGREDWGCFRCSIFRRFDVSEATKAALEVQESESCIEDDMGRFDSSRTRWNDVREAAWDCLLGELPAGECKCLIGACKHFHRGQDAIEGSKASPVMLKGTDCETREVSYAISLRERSVMDVSVWVLGLRPTSRPKSKL